MRFAIVNYRQTAGSSICASSCDLRRGLPRGCANPPRTGCGVRCQQGFAIDDAVQLHFDKAADASQLHDKSFHAKGDKRSEIEGRRRLPAAVLHALIFDVVLVEVVGERVEATVNVVSALKKDSS